MFGFSNYLTKSKYYGDSNKLVVVKMKDERGGVAIKKFVGLKIKMYSLLLNDTSQHKKTKGVNENVVDSKWIQICFAQPKMCKLLDE